MTVVADVAYNPTVAAEAYTPTVVDMRHAVAQTAQDETFVERY